MIIGVAEGKRLGTDVTQTTRCHGQPHPCTTRHDNHGHTLTSNTKCSDKPYQHHNVSYLILKNQDGDMNRGPDIKLCYPAPAKSTYLMLQSS